MPLDKINTSHKTSPPGSADKASMGRASAALRVADASAQSWVYNFLPDRLVPFAQLARLDRPIGAFLLMFPCWWSLGLATLMNGQTYPRIWYLVLFALGAVVMRAAGCAINDILDRNFDAKVARTKSRPLPSGRISVTAALVFTGLLGLIGLGILLQFNHVTIWLGIASLLPVAIYPLMKRITHWPQLVLGLTINWGALLGWSAIRGQVELPTLLLYAGCVLWTIGYDTIYAHQDKEDDLALGLKSTALRFGDQTRAWVAGFYAATWLLWALAAMLAGGGLGLLLALSVIALHLSWQVSTLDIANAANCLNRFRANKNIGWIFSAGVLVDMALAAL